MRVLKTKAFIGQMSHKELVEFVNENQIKKEDIVTITHFNDRFTPSDRYTLFYYSET